VAAEISSSSMHDELNTDNVYIVPSGELENDEAVALGDLDGLTKLIDRWGYDDCWPLIVDLRDRCRAALSRGKQLWPAAAYAEYRLALDAPPPFAAAVLGSSAERFALGPFAEVMASTHRFSALRDFLPQTPEAGMVAHECALRGEQFDGVTVPFADVLSIPLLLADWEPDYEIADYQPSKATFASPPLPLAFESVSSTRKRITKPIDDPETLCGLRDLVAAWASGSNGRVDTVAVRGTAEDAVATLGCSNHRRARIEPDEAMAHMAWAAASGGAQGRRRGAASGRAAAWWALQHLAGFDSEDRIEPDELGQAASELRWFWWDDGSPATGWALRLAIEDPAEGLAWAIAASDLKMA
jgi:Family of unknown function (DUF6183)